MNRPEPQDGYDQHDRDAYNAQIEPPCTKKNHNWIRPYEVVGGLKENPGVWSLGGTIIRYTSICKHCGCKKVETCFGEQRNPYQEDTIEYFTENDSCSY